MKLSSADITPSRVKFNSHEVHNPKCDILELVISSDAFITYCIELDTKAESMEYYAGSNYVAGSTAKSNSRHYQEGRIPKKYRNVWRGLREYYNNNYRNS
jgi:hypothetical protein